MAEQDESQKGLGKKNTKRREWNRIERKEEREKERKKERKEPVRRYLRERARTCHHDTPRPMKKEGSEKKKEDEKEHTKHAH